MRSPRSWRPTRPPSATTRKSASPSRTPRCAPPSNGSAKAAKPSIAPPTPAPGTEVPSDECRSAGPALDRVFWSGQQVHDKCFGEPLFVAVAAPAALDDEHAVDVRSGQCPQQVGGLFLGDV